MGGIGANWGSQSSHHLQPDKVVTMLRENGIQKVKLFDADYDTLRALGRSGIQVMVGIPNDMLSDFASNPKAAEKWVAENVTHHLTTNSVMIRSVNLYVASYFHILYALNGFFSMVFTSLSMN